MSYTVQSNTVDAEYMQTLYLCENASFGQFTQIREHNIIHGINSYESITEQETSVYKINWQVQKQPSMRKIELDLERSLQLQFRGTSLLLRYLQPRLSLPIPAQTEIVECATAAVNYVPISWSVWNITIYCEVLSCSWMQLVT